LPFEVSDKLTRQKSPTAEFAALMQVNRPAPPMASLAKRRWFIRPRPAAASA
jgi:hypothetical protein